MLARAVGTRRISAAPRLRYEGKTKPNSMACLSSGIASKKKAIGIDDAVTGAITPRGAASEQVTISDSSVDKSIHFPVRRRPASTAVENVLGASRLEHARAARRWQSPRDESADACGTTPDISDAQVRGR